MAARGEAHEGDWLIAARQTAGRGRMGRDWESPVGNFYGSTLVELREGDPPAPTLALAAGLGSVIAVGDPAYLKWPNDLMIGDAKVAGILLERQADLVVIGIGINVATAPVIGGRKTTCLDTLEPTLIDDLVGWLVQWIAWAIDQWRAQGVAGIVRRWGDEAHPIGTLLSVNLPDDERIDGTFDGLTDDGALRLRLADGAIRVIHAGDVFLI